jgi:hypothetical protein
VRDWEELRPRRREVIKGVEVPLSKEGRLCMVDVRDVLGRGGGREDGVVGVESGEGGVDFER